MRKGLFTSDGNNVSWSPTGKPLAPSTAPVGRNPEGESSAKAGDRVEGPRVKTNLG